jgi:hypothetical protein
MRDLIEALEIFLKYVICDRDSNDRYAPFHCEHDVLMVVCVEPDDVEPADIKRLDKLGFFPDGESGCFISYRYGSA